MFGVVRGPFGCIIEHSPLFNRSSPAGITPASGTETIVDKQTPVRVRLEKRQHRVFEFFVTERNYVDILAYLTQTALTVSACRLNTQIIYCHCGVFAV